jgi:hypothetical protein
MNPAFITKRFAFFLVTRAPDVALPVRVEFCMDAPLSESGKLPAELGSAPIASWIVARLRNLAPQAVHESGEEWNDGGGLCFELVMLENAKPVARVQLQADMEGAVVIGSAADEEIATAAPTELVELLLSDPAAVDSCRYEVYDPEWEEDPSAYKPRPKKKSRNEYGWEHGVYLGRYNIREDW